MEEKLQRVAAYGLIVNQHNQFLIVQRAPHDSNPLLWELPGGAVEHSEDPVEAVKREVWEEAGLSITPLYPVATSTGFSSKGKHIQVVRIAYLCKTINSLQEVILSNEHTAFRWITIENIPDLPISSLLQATLNQLKKFPELISIEDSETHLT